VFVLETTKIVWGCCCCCCCCCRAAFERGLLTILLLPSRREDHRPLHRRRRFFLLEHQGRLEQVVGLGIILRENQLARLVIEKEDAALFLGFVFVPQVLLLLLVELPELLPLVVQLLVVSLEIEGKVVVVVPWCVRCCCAVLYLHFVCVSLCVCVCVCVFVFVWNRTSIDLLFSFYCIAFVNRVGCGSM